MSKNAKFQAFSSKLNGNKDMDTFWKNENSNYNNFNWRPRQDSTLIIIILVTRIMTTKLHNLFTKMSKWI